MADKQQIVETMEAVDEEQGIPPNVYLPPKINGKQTRAIAIKGPVSVSDNIVRIHEDCDPIAGLIALANGQPVATYIVMEDGSTKTVYETATLAQRISIKKWLGDRAMPKVNVKLNKDLDDDWEAALRNAGIRESGQEDRAGGEGLPVLDVEPGGGD
jgi:hypothetical protein